MLVYIEIYWCVMVRGVRRIFLLNDLANVGWSEKEVVTEEMRENKARTGMGTMAFEVEGTTAPEVVSLANDMERMLEEGATQKKVHQPQEG